MVKPAWVWVEENFGDSLPSGFFGCELRESFLKLTCAVPAGSFVAVRPLHDGNAGSELGVVEEVAAVVRQPFDGFLIDSRRPFGARRLDERRRRGDDDLLRRRGLLERDGEGLGLPDAEVESLLDYGGEARQLRLDLVRAERQQHGAEAPGAVGDRDALVVRGGVLH